jgi:hypothetical protein
MQMALQTLGPVLQGLIPQGVVGPFNALITDWAKSLDIDPKAYMVPEPPPPPPPGPALPAPPSGDAAPPPEASGGGGPPMPPEAGPPMPPDQMPPELMP